MPLFSRPSTRSILSRALVLGVAAGLRSMAPLGTFARHRQDAPRTAGWRTWPLLRSGSGRALLQLGWAGEFVMDKLPTTPSRLEPRSLGARIAAGTIAGVAVGTEGRGATPKIGGALAGAIGAVAGSYGGYRVRTLGVESTALPDPAVAVVGDLAAAALARKGVRG